MSEPVRTPRCEACAAPLRWALTKNGKRMPFNLVPALAGTWVIGADGICRLAREVPGSESLPRYVPHWASCSGAPLFRGRAS